MPIGPSSRPQEPLHVFAMALALALAAFAGGALGVVWQWISGEDVPEDQIEAVSQPADEDEEEDAEAIPAPAPSPSPAPTPMPQPSPNAG